MTKLTDEQFQKAWNEFQEMGNEPEQSKTKLVNLISLFVLLHGEADGELFDKQTADDLRLLFDLHDFFQSIA